MTNGIDNLIVMANRIGDFFESQPNREESVAGIAKHIRSFWEPRMRKNILEFLAQHPDGVGPNETLTPITLEALQSNKDMLTPRATA